jgi:hypothetical protein
MSRTTRTTITAFLIATAAALCVALAIAIDTVMQ